MIRRLSAKRSATYPMVLPIRRSLLTALLLAGWAARAAAQGKRARPLIAYLGGSRPDASVRRTMVDPLVEGLRALGWVPGQHVDIEYRWADGQPERLPALLAELLKLEPSLLLTAGPRPAMLARDAGATLPASLPVLAVAVDDPVEMGLAVSYARPGGRFTGLSGAFAGILQKRLQLLKQLLPQARRFAVLANPLTNSVAELQRDLPEWERQLGVSLQAVTARSADEFDTAFATMVRDGVAAVAILADATFYVNREAIGALCMRHRLPAVVGGSGYLDAVGVISYQGDFAELFRRAATLAVKLLEGTRPGDIPWEQSTKLELVVNLSRAKALSLRVPQSVLVSADEVIE